jgi:hypothetical protein
MRRYVKGPSMNRPKMSDFCPPGCTPDEDDIAAYNADVEEWERNQIAYEEYLEKIWEQRHEDRDD